MLLTNGANGHLERSLVLVHRQKIGLIIQRQM
jgi:hypothetical protein